MSEHWRTAEPIADWDDAYANTAYIAGAEAFPVRWEAEAEAFRTALGERARTGIPYGPRPRQKFDLFLPEGAPTGLVVFVHGGYWMARDRSDWSHLAAGGLARGWAVAMPSYTLCPAATLADIRAEIGRAVGVAAAEVPGPVVLTGHSAGGHLVTRAICRDAHLPEIGRVAGVVSISGVHDLRPLLRTSMATTLRLDARTAAAESPALLTPHQGIPVTAWVGAAERPEFLRQAALLSNVWTGLGTATGLAETPGAHHFDVIDLLGDPASPLMEALLGPADPPLEAGFPEAAADAVPPADAVPSADGEDGDHPEELPGTPEPTAPAEGAPGEAPEIAATAPAEPDGARRD